MVDPGTGLAILGGSPLFLKLLGPTAEYLGGELQQFTERRVANLRNIFENGLKKLGDQIEEEGGIAPKILRGIIEEGSYCEDELGAEYFGGVLASSRSSVERDDRGATFINLLARLSTYQIRSHYIFYSIARQLFLDSGLGKEFESGEARDQMTIFIPHSCYMAAMDFNEREQRDFMILMAHIFGGLVRESLIEGNTYNALGRDLLRKITGNPKFSEGGIFFKPSIAGAELFLWAYGFSNLRLPTMFFSELELEKFPSIKIPSGYIRAKELNQFVDQLVDHFGL